MYMRSEMVYFSESFKIIWTSGKMDNSDTYNVFSSGISFFIHIISSN